MEHFSANFAGAARTMGRYCKRQSTLYECRPLDFEDGCALARFTERVWQMGKCASAISSMARCGRLGAWLETLVKWFHVEAIRGSSSWRGAKALQELETHQNTRCDIIITPDGPKGPRCQCKPGSLHWTAAHHFDVIAPGVLCCLSHKFL